MCTETLHSTSALVVRMLCSLSSIVGFHKIVPQGVHFGILSWRSGLGEDPLSSVSFIPTLPQVQERTYFALRPNPQKITTAFHSHEGRSQSIKVHPHRGGLCPKITSLFQNPESHFIISCLSPSLSTPLRIIYYLIKLPLFPPGFFFPQMEQGIQASQSHWVRGESHS